MSIVSYIVIFVSIWWIVFFMALPFSVRVPTNPVKGHADSAPINPRLGIKIIITSLISALITWGVIFLIEKGYFNILLST